METEGFQTFLQGHRGRAARKSATRIISSYDLVIDIHSTESGSGDMVIITKINKDTKKILKYLSPKYVLFMNTGPDKSLISSARLGIAFEMGSDKDKKTIKKTIKGIESLLNYANLIKKPRTFKGEA